MAHHETVTQGRSWGLSRNENEGGAVLSADQDMSTRIVYVVRARDELIRALKDVLDAEGLQILSRPYVVMTQELPYELYFESWGRAIIKVCKARYLSDELEYGEVSIPACQAIIDIDTDDKQGSFDRWWHIERAEGYTEIEPTWLGPYYGYAESE